MEEQEEKFLAEQLRKPSGAEGIKTGEKMFKGNGSMIRKAIDLLPLKEGDKVLEIGYGNGAHLDYLFQKTPQMHYKGVDISETMQQEATANNQEKVKTGIAEFLLGNGIKIPAEDEEVDSFFTVNTIYFWEDHKAVIQEIRRVLKPGGNLCIALGSRSSMEKLPFTKYGFRMFHPQEVSALLEEGGFRISSIVEEEEILEKEFLNIKKRELVLVLATKPG